MPDDVAASDRAEPEMRHLLASGADGAVLAERELAYSMAEMVLGAPQATATPVNPATPAGPL